MYLYSSCMHALIVVLDMLCQHSYGTEIDLRRTGTECCNNCVIESLDGEVATIIVIGG